MKNEQKFNLKNFLFMFLKNLELEALKINILKVLKFMDRSQLL